MGGFDRGMSLGDKNVMRIMKMRDVKMRPIFLLIVSILPMMAHAQWTEQDSLRLQEIFIRQGGDTFESRVSEGDRKRNFSTTRSTGNPYVILAK